jgi:hypothetical protein
VHAVQLCATPQPFPGFIGPRSFDGLGQTALAAARWSSSSSSSSMMVVTGWCYGLRNNWLLFPAKSVCVALCVRNDTKGCW